MFSLQAEVPNKEHDYVRRSWLSPCKFRRRGANRT
jgi:hypothetical protein